MTNLELSTAEASFLKEFLIEYETKLITRIKELTELIAFSKTLNDDCLSKLKEDGNKLSNNLVLCKSIYYDLTTIY